MPKTIVVSKCTILWRINQLYEDRHIECPCRFPLLFIACRKRLHCGHAARRAFHEHHAHMSRRVHCSTIRARCSCVSTRQIQCSPEHPHTHTHFDRTTAQRPPCVVVLMSTSRTAAAHTARGHASLWSGIHTDPELKPTPTAASPQPPRLSKSEHSDRAPACALKLLVTLSAENVVS